MYRERVVGVVIPAYNEAGFVGDVIERMPSFVDRIYVVDDSSTDGTWAEILAAASIGIGIDTDAGGRVEDANASTADGSGLRSGTQVAGERSIGDGYGRNPLFERADVGEPIGRVVPIRHERNRGAGGAIKTGYLAALADEIGVDITATIDADGQMDARMLPRFLDPIVDDDAEYTKGNRLLNRDFRREMPRFRLFGNQLLTYLTKIASGYWKTMDPQNGYTAIATETLEAVEVAEMYEYYGYCTDLLIKLNIQGTRVADVAIPARYGEETSSIKYDEYIRKVSLLLLGGFLWRLRVRYLLLDFHPLALLYVLGALTVGVGIIEAIGTLALAVAGVGAMFTAGALSILTLVAGCGLLIVSMTFDMQANEGLETQVSN